MKRLSAIFITLVCCCITSKATAQIYVSPEGNDAGKGTSAEPKATLAAALRQVRDMRRLDTAINGAIHIYLRKGIYELYEPVFIRPEDAGTKQSPTLIEATAGEEVVLSGGRTITGWKKITTRPAGLPASSFGYVWVTDLPLINGNTWEFRQLWINGVKAIRAKSPNGAAMQRIRNWNKKEQSCIIPANGFIPLLKTEGVEMLIHQWWAIANLRIRQMKQEGDSIRLFFHDPESRIQSEHPWPAPWLSKETGNSAFYLTNAIELLDEPGEWYLDIPDRKLYYWPRKNENLATAIVTAPVLETLVRVEGTVDHPVTHISFHNISFQHTGWLRPSHYGHVPHQAGMYMLDAYKLKIPGTPDKKSLENQAWVGRPAAAVSLNYASATAFENCSFTHMASTALDYGKGTIQNRITGNLFKDIGGTAIVAGVFSDEATEVHLPYNPADERDICSGLLVNNNLITDATNEDWGCVGIAAGYVRDARIEHNEISEVSYSGISLGWGWTKTKNALRNNQVTGNYIHHYAKHMYDVAGIYTLSAQPGTVIANNRIDSIYKAPYAHIPSHWFYLYTDEGSSFITVKNNWTPAEKYLQNANGPGNVWTNNGPKVADSTRRMAGLEKQYRGLQREIVTSSQAINRKHPVIIELVAANDAAVDLQQLRDLVKGQQADPLSLYQWQHHYVIFGEIKDINQLSEKIKNTFPALTVKTYNDLFYEFNRERCGDQQTAAEWQHTILTASLVPDKKMQQEYFDYHATQYEKWPEVSKGFCNAEFQQLLLFRNERQLMLVISTPKGKSLDELNSKTTENNPRVDEWNKRMSNYQQGIEGTKKGETWVFLQPVLTN